MQCNTIAHKISKRSKHMPMTSVRMSDQLMTELESISEKLDRSKGWVIKDALSQYVARIEQNERMLRETKQALSDIESGNFVDGEEVMNWIESWGTDDVKASPKI